MTRYRMAIVTVMSVAVALFVESAQAGVVIDITQVGSGASATVDVSDPGGTLNLTGLTLLQSGASDSPEIAPFDATAILGATSGGLVDAYLGLSGPSSFGGGPTGPSPTSGAGPIFGIVGSVPELIVPTGFTGGTLAASSNTYSGTLSGLGFTPGSYKWTWSGDSLTVNIVSSTSIPEPSTAVLAAFGAVTLCAYRWCRHRRHPRRQAAA
jgi:hypothetical protein